MKIKASALQPASVLALTMVVGMFGTVYSKHAHSFAHFHGPVEGHHHEITIPDKHGHHHTVDYVAHPKYKFAYGVEDHHTGDFHGQKEHRDVAVTTTRAVLTAATEPTSSTTMVITGTIKPLDSSKQISHYLHISSSKLSHFYHRRLALDDLDRTNSKYFLALPESALKLMGMFCLYDLHMKNELRGCINFSSRSNIIARILPLF
uniref:Uncharacterized protein n=1 Tax=Trichogramma kaykai TaxID=54128 RepID=A0ABD2X645_9HYME